MWNLLAVLEQKRTPKPNLEHWISNSQHKLSVSHIFSKTSSMGYLSDGYLNMKNNVCQ